ncbi:PREDICTED: baculoviral IAP repeat-containing protein 5-like, partial [Nestor notabilis]|uniref:baculoviral IAP repeat-containing protein 5-like n=1 Tax=Nestor notabilis TaxID=176057 RepID=UPI000523E3E8
EHKKHSPRCAFISLQKDPSNLTLQEFLKLDRERMKNAAKKEISQKVTDVQGAAKIVRREIMSLSS